MGYIMEMERQESYHRMYSFPDLEIKYGLKRGSTKGNGGKETARRPKTQETMSIRWVCTQSYADRTAIPEAAERDRIG
jgi:hypothetical protein